jgi:Family of unknown function (DUF6114)
MYENHDERPIAATILSLLAGLLIVIGGLFIASLGSDVSAAGYYAAGGLLGGLGLLGLLFGFLIVLLSIGMYRNPEGAVGYGIAILVLSLLSVFSGGGFILGLILGVIGGILGIVFHPSEEELPWETSRSNYSMRRHCPNCSTAMADTATACPTCRQPASVW